jgi:hypothetical protein
MPISSGFGRTLPHHEVDKVSIDSKPSFSSSQEYPRIAFGSTFGKPNATETTIRTPVYTETSIKTKSRWLCCYSVR